MERRATFGLGRCPKDTLHEVEARCVSGSMPCEDAFSRPWEYSFFRLHSGWHFCLLVLANTAEWLAVVSNGIALLQLAILSGLIKHSAVTVSWLYAFSTKKESRQNILHVKTEKYFKAKWKEIQYTAEFLNHMNLKCMQTGCKQREEESDTGMLCQYNLFYIRIFWIPFSPKDYLKQCITEIRNI